MRKSRTSIYMNTSEWEQQDWNKTKTQRKKIRLKEWMWKKIQQARKKDPKGLPYLRPTTPLRPGRHNYDNTTKRDVIFQYFFPNGVFAKSVRPDLWSWCSYGTSLLAWHPSWTRPSRARSTHMCRNVIDLIWEVDAVTAHLCHDVFPEYDHLVRAVLKAARVAHELGAGDLLSQLRHEVCRQGRSTRPGGRQSIGIGKLVLNMGTGKIFNLSKCKYFMTEIEHLQCA